MRPLWEKWVNLSDEDQFLPPLFECLASVAPAFGDGFLQFSEAVFGRCIMLVANTLTQIQVPACRATLLFASVLLTRIVYA